MIRQYVENGYIIAQKIAPKDTKNLVLNGIRKRVSEVYGEIVYDSSIVPYIDLLEEGTKRYEGAKGFIENTTVDEIIKTIYAIGTGQFDRDKFASIRQEVSQYTPTTRTNARYLQSIGGVVNVTK